MNTKLHAVADANGRPISFCLIPWFDGVTLSQEWKEALWDR